MSTSCCCGIRPTHRKLLRNNNTNATIKPNLKEPLDLPITLQIRKEQNDIKEVPVQPVVQKKKSSMALNF